ncbi:hypothetical protein [Dactylosporangium sp. NPDC000521]|uniref:hypothetical protein n=1 Tax=Dactylosporangium sp. NPDC000521 TaxID=3363975 RepID=UPI0036A4BF01
MAGSLARVVQALWRGQPRFAEAWPWLVGPLAVAVTALIVAGRLAGGGESQAAVPAELGRPVGDPSMESARRLAESGKRIQAVKVVRQLTGASLEEALTLVKAMEKDADPE